MGFWCGAVPSSLTLPVIWPAGAALTLPPEYNNPDATTNIAEANARTLYRAFIGFSPFLCRFWPVLQHRERVLWRTSKGVMRFRRAGFYEIRHNTSAAILTNQCDFNYFAMRTRVGAGELMRKRTAVCAERGLLSNREWLPKLPPLPRPRESESNLDCASKLTKFVTFRDFPAELESL
jgi:hypothetical protein